jgi:DNA polymerase III delta prime subunit
VVPADGWSGVGRTELLERIANLESQSEIAEALRRSACEDRDTYRKAMLLATKELDAVYANLTAAQTAGTEVQLGRQRARHLLREVLLSRALSPEDSVMAIGRSVEQLAILLRDIEKELGMLTQREQNDLAAKAVGT